MLYHTISIVIMTFMTTITLIVIMVVSIGHSVVVIDMEIIIVVFITTIHVLWPTSEDTVPAAALLSNESTRDHTDQEPCLCNVQGQEDVRPQCFYNEDTTYFGLPSPEQLASYYVVVCTCGGCR